MTSSGQVYLFRHALLRDAAYELQPPSDRARLHALALHLMEQAFGGQAPLPGAGAFEPHGTDAVALELAGHARVSGNESRLRLYLERAAEVAERSFHNHEALECWRELAVLLADDRSAEVLRRAAIIAFHVGDIGLAEQLAKSSLDCARSGGHRRHEGLAFGALANIFRETGRLQESQAAYEAALAIHREVGNISAEGIELGNLGGLLTQVGRLKEAEQSMRRAMEIHRRAGNRRSEGTVLSALGTLCHHAGDPEQARQLTLQALAIHRADGNRQNEGVALGNLAALEQYSGNLSVAESLTREALGIYRQTGSRGSQGVALGNLASLLTLQERFEEARSLFDEALAIHREVGSLRFEGVHTCELALLLMQQGRLSEARATWSHGASLLARSHSRSVLADEVKAMREACARAGVPPLDETGAAGGGT
ncbi:MAG: tetratricopeptide repeat protein [Planctomycetes bacterium]|nr:tetratricopeptide repeat protein [Planctomycetota bacterium]